MGRRSVLQRQAGRQSVPQEGGMEGRKEGERIESNRRGSKDRGSKRWHLTLPASRRGTGVPRAVRRRPAHPPALPACGGGGELGAGPRPPRGRPVLGRRGGNLAGRRAPWPRRRRGTWL